MADVNANINIDISTAQALSQLKALQRQISQFHTSIARSSEAAALAQRDLQKNFINSVNSIGAFSAELRSIKTTAESFTDALEKNKFGMREYFRYSAGATRTFGRLFKSEFDTINKVAEENVKRLQTQYIKMGRDANGVMRAIAIMPKELDMSSYNTQVQLSAQRQAIFNQLVKQGTTNLLNFGKNTQWAGRQLMVGFTLPLATLGTVATRTFMEMETAALKFRKVYGDLFTPAEERAQALRDIQSLGNIFTKYGISVAQTVNLAADAAAAGFQGLDLQRQVTEATRLQVLGQIDQQKALETTISLQNAFKLSNEDLTDSINFLNAVENQTVVSLDDITTAIPKVAPVIMQLGGSVRDLAFFMTAMKQGGVNASEGANALKSGLAALINPTEKASKFLGDMGINITDIVERNQGRLRDTVIEFARALDTLDPLARARAIEQLFGKFQFARLSTLFENVTKTGTQAARTLELAGFSAEELALTAESELGMTAESGMMKFRKAVEDLRASLVPVGETFLQAVTPIIEFIGGILEKFNNLSSGTKKAITILTVAIGAIGPVVLMTFGLLANALANILKGANILRNGYLRLTGQSQLLAAQTDYLTIEQQNAAAVASSLEQSHARLKQTFDVEAASVDKLAAAYRSAVSAGARFAQINPGMMLPPRFRGYAKGGEVFSVPGSGNQDTVPAMLTPGEMVVPKRQAKKYAPLIQGIIADNIPGFKKGGGIERAHATMPFAQESSQFQSMLNLIPELKKLNDQFPGVIRVVSNLTAELPAKLNQAMKGTVLSPGGVDIASFQQQYGSLQDKFAASALRGGANITNPAVEAAIRKFEIAVGERAVVIAKGTERQKVNDDIFAQATRDVVEEFKRMDAESQQVAQALDKVSTQVGQVRIGFQSDKLRQAIASGAITVNPATQMAQFGNLDVARLKSTRTQSGQLQFRPANPIGTPLNYQTGRDLATFTAAQSTQVVNESILAAQRTAQTQSPSRRTIPIGEDIARGLSVGMMNQADDVAATAGSITQSAIGGMRSTGILGPGGQEIMVPVGPQPSAPLQNIQENIAVSQELQDVAQEQVNAIRESNTRMSSLNSRIMGASFALSALSGVTAMFADGPLAQFSGVISKITMGMFALMSVTQALTQTQAVRLVQERLAVGGFLAKEGVGATATFTRNTKLFSGGIKSLLPNLAKFGGGIAKMLGPVGMIAVGLGALAFVINRFSKAKKEELLLTEQFAQSLSTTKDQVKALGEFFGVVPKETPFALRQREGQREITSAAKRTQRESLKADPAFQKEFENTIQRLRQATNEEAKLIFSSLALNLQAQGFAKDQVQTIIDALREESSKTDIVLDVKSLNLSGSSLKELQTQMAPILATFSSEMNKSVTRSARSRATGEVITWTEMTDGAKQSLETLSAFISETGKNLAAMFEYGLIDGKTYEKSLNSIMLMTTKLDQEQRKVLLTKMFEKLGVNASRYLDTLYTVQQETRLLALISAGVLDKDSPILKGLQSKDSKAQQRAIGALKKEYDKLFGAIEKVNKEEKDGAGTGGQGKANIFQEQVTQIKNQIEAYKKLRAAKIDAATASEIAGNAEMAKLIAEGKGIAKNIGLIREYAKLRRQMALVEEAGLDIGDATVADLNRKKAFINLQEQLINMQYSHELERQNNALRDQERSLELIGRKIAEIQQEQIRPLEQIIEENTFALEKISLAEDEVNEKYDRQQEALSRILEINEDINKIQKSRLTVADALTRGDIAAAAQAVQDLRNEQANISASNQQKNLDLARKAEISALGRNKLEQENKKLQFEITKIQFEQIRKYEQQKQAIDDNVLSIRDLIADIEYATAVSIEKMNQKFKETFGGTKTEIENALQALDLSKAAGLDINDPNLLQNILKAAGGEATALSTLLGTLPAKFKAILDEIAAMRKEMDLTGVSNIPNIPIGQQTPCLPGYQRDASGNCVKIEEPKIDQSILDAANKAAQEAIAAEKAAKEAAAAEALLAKQTEEEDRKAIASRSAGSLVARFFPRREFATLSKGGQVEPKYMAVGGLARGSDKVPAMLTPGEFVMSKYAVQNYGLEKLKAINSGSNYSDSVYNYSINVNVKSDSNANQIAKEVMNQIKYIDSQRVRTQRAV